MKVAWILPLLLSGCVIERIETPSPPQPVKVVHSSPAAVWPDACVANWYAKTSLPPCVEAWITDITKQQKSIERRRKKKPQAPRRS